MAKFIVQLSSAFERELRKIRMPTQAAPIVQRAFAQSVDKVYNSVIQQTVSASDLMEDLESGVIAAIFGMKPSQQAEQIEKFRELFRQKSTVRLSGDNVTAIIQVNQGDISKLKFTNTTPKSGITVTFKWLDILLKGLTEDNIQAKIMEDIGVEEYVPHESIFSKSLLSGLQRVSRSGHAIMIVPEKSPRVKTLLDRGFTRRAAQVSESFQFRVIPHPFLLNDIFSALEAKMSRLIAIDFNERIKKLPPTNIA